MKEIGGYIELDRYRMPMLHEKAIALNSGRGCLSYLIRLKKIQKIRLPFFLCDSVKDTCSLEGVSIKFYSISESFEPEDMFLEEDEWLYIVNYYGQITREKMQTLIQKYNRVIIDQAQAYFDRPVVGAHTLYTCRKFFGVPDGGFLYTDGVLAENLPIDESYNRMHFLHGRFERSASEFYNEYAKNNELFETEGLKKMSKLTNNLLHGIDYKWVKDKRSENYHWLHQELGKSNNLKLRETEGAFAYPLWIANGEKIRKQLIAHKVFIPTLWPDVLKNMPENTLEYQLAQNILPLPCDQRYDCSDMKYMVSLLYSFL